MTKRWNILKKAHDKSCNWRQAVWTIQLVNIHSSKPDCSLLQSQFWKCCVWVELLPPWRAAHFVWLFSSLSSSQAFSTLLHDPPTGSYIFGSSFRCFDFHFKIVDWCWCQEYHNDDFLPQPTCNSSFFYTAVYSASILFLASSALWFSFEWGMKRGQAGRSDLIICGLSSMVLLRLPSSRFLVERGWYLPFVSHPKHDVQETVFVVGTV